MTGREALSRNDAAYTDLLGLRDGLGRHPRAVAALTEATAEFCEFNHPGRFADGALENSLLQIAAELGPAEVGPQWRGTGSRRRVLHVTTQVAILGGHTRTVHHWVKADQESAHSLLVTGQGKSPIPDWLCAAVESSGGVCLVLPTPCCPLVRGRRVRGFARQADLVVLHHFGHDVVPVLALAGAGPPVALVNHADHMFWMGGTVADLIVNQREIGRELSERRRHVRANDVLPVPLADARTNESRAAIRARLGIPGDQTVLLSVGRSCKYAPTPTHNFFRTAARILTEHPDAHVYLLGVSESDLAGEYSKYRHERFHFLGPRESAADYQRAADVYLEGFPFGSQTALLEAALAGVPVVPAFSPPLRLLATSDESLVGLADTPGNEDEYVQRVGTFVRDADARAEVGRALREAVLACHVGPGWRGRLDDVYARTDGLVHTFGRLPQTDAQTTADDLALGEWQASRPAGACHLPPRTAARQAARAAAFGLREAGCHGAGFALLRRALRRWGPHRSVLADLAKLAPHRALAGLRG